MEYVLLAPVLILAWLVYHYRISDEAFNRAYNQAMWDDYRYARKHPGCTLEEAHANRRRVRKIYGRP